MKALDSINTKWGKGKLHYAAEDLSNLGNLSIESVHHYM